MPSEEKEEEAPVSTAEPPGGYGSGPSSKDFGPAANAEAVAKGRIKALVTVGLALATVSTLLVLAIVGVRRYIRVAKTAEARINLRRMTEDVARVYEAEHRLCPSASGPVPDDATWVRQRKYQSTTADWLHDKERNAGFACLGFEMAMPQYYQYNYEATATSFTARASGDLNGNGISSYFSWSGKVAAGKLVIDSDVTDSGDDE